MFLSNRAQADVERRPRSRSSSRLLRTYVPPEVFGRYTSLRRDRLLHDVANAAGINLDAGAHRAADRDGPQVAALGRRGLGPDQLVDHRRVVLEQTAIVEAPLADGQMNDRVAVGAVLDLAGLGLLHRTDRNAIVHLAIGKRS